MRTERRWISAAAVCLALGSGAGPLWAQAPLFLVDDRTRVASLSFVFPEGRTLALNGLEQQTALTDPGLLAGIQRSMAWLPLVRPPAPVPFDPVQLQKDVIRLRRYYGSRGYPRAEVSYEVRLDSMDNAVDVRMVVVEGQPVVLTRLTITGGDGDPIAERLPVSLQAAWANMEEQTRRSAIGRVFGETDQVRIRTEPLRWARNNGYAFANVSDRVEVDSTALSASSHVTLVLGPRARVDSILMEGNAALSQRTLGRELPFRVGDWYSANRVNEGQRQIFGLDLVRLALTDVPGQEQDSTVTVRYRIEEGRPRIVSGEVGYSSVSGIRTGAEWTHRDFKGGARVLTTSVDVRSALLALEGNADRRIGASVSMRQPYFFDRRVSATVSPFVEYRDGIIDRSWSYGIGGAVHWEKGVLENVSLEYRLSRREVLEIRAGVQGLDGVPLLDAVAALDSLESGVASSVLALSTLHGNLDDPLRPRRGWVVRTSTELAGPAAISGVEYARGQADVLGFVRLGRDVGLAARAGAGLLRPFGISAPTATSDTTALLIRLREAMLSAGGTQSVRGWGTGLLGPKLPNFRIINEGDSTRLEADRYVPFAGLARVTASAELQLPMPFSESQNGTFVFVDGGRVWNPDARFGGGSTDLFDQEKFFWSTGGGVRFETLAGSVRIAVGYKLNPSVLDLRDPRLVGAALIAGLPPSTVPASTLRRFHLHLAIGRGL